MSSDDNDAVVLETSSSDGSGDKPDAKKEAKKLGLLPLIALIVGSSIGGGIFNATTSIASNAPAGIAILSWLIVGGGFLLLVLALNNIMKNRADLDGGLVQHAEEGFGKFWGLMSGWGYWLSAWLGNVAFAALLLSAFGGLSDVFNLTVGDNAFETSNILPFMFVSVIMWGLMLLVTRGIESAAVINAIVLVAKFVPLILILITGFVVFKAGIFTSDFWQNVMTNEDGSAVSVWNAISGSFMVMIWCFVGIEGACMFGDKAKTKKSVGKATIIGFVVLLVAYILLSILPYGYLTQGELADLGEPALGYVLQEMFGGSKAGLYIVNIGLIISILGAWLSWTLLPVQTLELMEKREYLPEKFGKKNKNGVPVFSLLVTTICCQVFMLVFLFPKFTPAGLTPYDFAVIVCGSAVLITWLLSALYQIVMKPKDGNAEGFSKKPLDIVIGVLAAAFQAFMIIVAGWQYIALSFVVYIPAFVMYYLRRKKEGEEKPFKGANLICIALVGVVAVLGIILVATGVVAL